MKKKYKKLLKLNFASIFFLVLSFSSLTLAWFSYSGLSKASMDITVKGWYIELEKNGQKAKNNVVVSLSEIYPGMDTTVETIKIKNYGDYDALIDYSITSARILGDSNDNFVSNDEESSKYIEDVLSHNYPFHINIDLSRNYILSSSDDVEFKVSVSWPLNSGDDELDSIWGMAAYKFRNEELLKNKNNDKYQIEPPIKLEIKLTAKQYIEEDNSSDTNYNLGQNILYDVVNNKKCKTVSDTCLSTYVIDTNNLLSDNYVNVIPDINNLGLMSNHNEYVSNYNQLINNWSVENRYLEVKDILKIISKDIENSFVIVNNLSDSIIGNLTNEDRINSEINRIINMNGYYKFLNSRYQYLKANTCYWTNSRYDDNNTFAYDVLNDDFSKLIFKDNSSECKVVPVLKLSKENLIK